ncbi:MAG: sugar transferase [Clostridia bacterium]|nr:sugar transferase [Clostridia bacterium]
MTRLGRGFRRHKSELLVALLKVIVYLGLFSIFFGMMSIHNWQLRVVNRTLATTLLTWLAMSVAMTAVYGGYDVGRRKSRPIISGMELATVVTDAVTYLQLQIMNVNDNNEQYLRLFGPDFWLLIACVALQSVFLILMVRWGNKLYFALNPPHPVLVVLDDPGEEEDMRRKIGRYALQWRISRTLRYDDPDIEQALRESDTVFLGHMPDGERLALVERCYQLKKNVYSRAQLTDILLSASATTIVDDAPFLEIEASRITFMQRVVKRLCDIFVSVPVLIALAPMMGVIALLVRIEDGGPALFRQERITVGGRSFRILKFRTMEVGSPDRSAEKDDRRITRVGSVLRRWRLDELPQFWNILRGDMTLVGPRPEMLANVSRYKSELPDFVYREKMKAGLTGYAQIEGRYNTSAEDKLMLDLMYIENFSTWNDFRLLLRTLTVLFKPDSVEGFDGNAPE